MRKKREAILSINLGSSSLKYSAFEIAYNGKLKELLSKKISSSEIDVEKMVNSVDPEISIKAVGHRVVHGGPLFFEPTIINSENLKSLESLVPLASLHMLDEVSMLKDFLKLMPGVPQIACFDTTFHINQKRLYRLYALPRKHIDAGIMRYGFHGLSYEYIAQQLLKRRFSQSKSVIAHLGSGASACALENNKSIATSMGFSALEGMMMGTRCGHLDPGIILYLAREKKMSIKQIETMLYHESGLLGVSGISSNMKDLEMRKDSNSQEAVDLFCYKAASEISALLASLQGMDLLVFTGGIGENSSIVRAKICEHFHWLGLRLDTAANNADKECISSRDSKISVYIIRTNEEYMIAELVNKYVVK